MIENTPDPYPNIDFDSEPTPIKEKCLNSLSPLQE